MSSLKINIIAILICLVAASFVANSHPGIGIEQDSKGNIYFTDLEHVWKITPEGTVEIALNDIHTHEIYIDEHDNIYGEHEWYEGEETDKWGNLTWRLNKKGKLDTVRGPVEGFLDNSGLVRDENGNSFWTKKSDGNEHLMIESKDGKSKLLTNHVFKNIRWLYYSKQDKHIYVVDYLKLKRVSPKGKVTVLADNLREEGLAFENLADRHYVYGVWTDKNHTVYVALYGAGKVKKISQSGVIETYMISNKGWSPCGGHYSEDGTMWIMEFSTDNKIRVKKISTDGKVTIYKS